MENDGQVTGTSNAGISVSQSSSGSTGSTTITNIGSVVGAANRSAINVSENSAGTVTVNNNNGGLIGPSLASSSSLGISEQGGSLIVNNNGRINGSVTTVGTGAFSGIFNNNAGATWQVGNIDDEGIITGSGSGSVISLIGTSGRVDVGKTGTGNLVVQAGATLTTASLFVANQVSGVGQLTVTGNGSTVFASALNLGAGAASIVINQGGAINIGGVTSIGNALHVGGSGTVFGNGIIQGNLVDDSNVTASGGTLKIIGDVSGSGTLQVNGTSTLELAGAASTNITFSAGSTGTLQIDSSASFSGTVTGFTGSGTGDPATSDKIDLGDVDFSSPNFTKSYLNNVLTVSDGSHTANLKFSGSYTLANFDFATDGSNGTLITDPPATSEDGTSPSCTVPTDPVTITDGSTVELNSAYSRQVTFSGPIGTGTLLLDHSVDFCGTVAGMLGQDTLDLRDIDFPNVQRPLFSGTDSNGTLSVSDGLHTANIQLLGNYIAAAFAASGDGHGATSIEVLPHPVTMLASPVHA